MHVLLNHQLIDRQQACIDMQSEAVMFGFGAFETLKIKDATPAYFAEHCQRLTQTCKQLNVNYAEPAATCHEQALRLIKHNQQREGVLKINVFKQGQAVSTLMTTAPPRYHAATYRQGFSIACSQHRLHSRGPLVGLKHNNYLANLVCLQAARADGYDEALFLNEADHLVEGCVSNLFFVKQNTLFTPCPSTGLLNGIYRQQVLKAAQQLKLTVEIGHYTLADLTTADEIFVTNSLLEIMPVSQLMDKALDIRQATVTQKLVHTLATSNP